MLHKALQRDIEAYKGKDLGRGSFGSFGKPPRQASRQGGLDRPYQNHLGGLGKGYKKPLKSLFKMFSEAF